MFNSLMSNSNFPNLFLPRKKNNIKILNSSLQKFGEPNGRFLRVPLQSILVVHKVYAKPDCIP